MRGELKTQHENNKRKLIKFLLVRVGNMPVPTQQYGIDLANREQRGSAFELYRKPQIGAHGMR